MKRYWFTRRHWRDTLDVYTVILAALAATLLLVAWVRDITR